MGFVFFSSVGSTCASEAPPSNEQVTSSGTAACLSHSWPLRLDSRLHYTFHLTSVLTRTSQRRRVKMTTGRRDDGMTSEGKRTMRWPG